MHIVFQNEIIRGQDISSAISSLGWQGHQIETERFSHSIEDIDRTLFKTALDPNDPIMVFAGIRLASHLQYKKLTKVQSGVIADQAKLTWSSYATHLPNDMLLNPFGILFPWGYLRDPMTVRTVKKAFGEDGVFIRPNSPWKPFAGFDTTWDQYAHNLSAYEQLEAIDAGEICVLFPRKTLDVVEWRFWIVAGEIATYAPYSWSTLPDEKRSPPADMIPAVEKAIRYLDGYEDSLVIDMADTPNGAKIVELNGLTTSGFYDGMDVTALLSSLPAMFGLPAAE
ncbi:ATP-grasp domain-containing protein [Sulfitobacter sp. R18_1]|uniref:ATP-grasp domain-containing protein n=1 Tax=Sulfitobacter sp. R18_1 TaxID=2821104 RepID=UPI001AD9DBF8|nr:ATP-grasp domain-containing protein [Sulfitobacter sp. R18_1]MBO9428365.1 ATP-grasp domain-containing protein [Sulfitobacter sp. R18_1]